MATLVVPTLVCNAISAILKNIFLNGMNNLPQTGNINGRLVAEVALLPGGSEKPRPQ